MNIVYIKRLSALILFITISVFFAQAQSWTALNGPTGGNIRKITMDANNNVYALVGDGGDVYKSSNGGATWSMITGSLGYLNGVEAIGSDLYVNTWSEVFKSTNGGSSWTKVSINTDLNHLDRSMYFVNGINGLLIIGTQGAWLSIDSGINWKKIYDKEVMTAAFSSVGDIFMTANEVGLLKHPAQTGSLTNWDKSKVITLRPKQLPTKDNVFTVGVNRNNSDKVFISYQNSSASSLIYEVSTNGGTNWTTITSPTTGTPGTSWWTFEGKFYHITHSLLHEVTDGATPSFTQKGKAGFSYYQNISLYYKNINEIYIGVEGDGVWKSTDNAGTFTISNGTPPSAIMSIPARDVDVMGSRMMLVPHSDSWGYWTSTNEGANWSWITMPSGIRTYYPHKIFERLQDNSIVVGTAAGTYRTTDGQSWILQSTETFHDYVPVSSTELYGFRSPNTVMKSTNNGATWSAVTVPTAYPSNINDVLVAAYDGVNFYLAMNRPTGQEFWKLNLTSQTATKMNVALQTGVGKTSGMFVFKGKLYIGDGQRIAISNDQGNTFKYLDYSHEYLFPINQKVGGIGISKAGTLVITQDDGITFSSTALPRAEHRIVNIVSPDNGFNTYAATAGGPVLKYTTTSSDTLIYNKTSPYIDFGWTKMDGPSGGGSGRRLFKSSSNQLFHDNWNSIHRFNETTKEWEYMNGITLNNHSMFHDGTNIYQATSYQLFKSTDGGNTSSKVSESQFSDLRGEGQGIFKTAAGIVFALSSNGLYRSANDGVTFTKVKSGRNHTAIAEGGTTLLVASNDGTNMFIERSTDGGITWSAAQSGITFPAKINGEDVLVSDGANTFIINLANNIYRTTDGGLTWNSIFSNLATLGENSNPDWCCNTKAYVSPTGDYYFAAFGYPMRLYVSTNKGTSWTRKNTNTTGSKFNDIHDIIWVGTRMYAVSGWYEGVLFSDDAGATWNVFENNKGLNTYHNWGVGGQLNISGGLMNQGSEQALSTSTNKGTSWSTINAATPKFLNLPNGDLLAYGNGTPFKSTDSGATWTAVSNQYSWFPFITYTGSNYVAIGHPTSCCTQGFYTSTDLVNWTPFQVSGIPSGITGFNSLASLGSKLYVQGYNTSTFINEVYEINSGVATRIANLSNNLVQVVSRDNTLYVFSSDGYIYQTTDGTNWATRSVPTGAGRLIFANNGYLFLSGGNGLLWVSRDGGKSWQNVSATNVKGEFGDIAIDLATGIAFGTLPARPLFKSSNIVVPDDKTGPTVQSFIPVDNAINVKAIGLKLTIVFNEGATPVAGKNLRIYRSTDQITPVETIAVTSGVSVDNRVTFTPTFTPTDLVTYYITIDDGAFKDFYGNLSVSISNPTTWNFTMEDATAPTIEFITSNLEKGVAKTFEVTVKDDGGIDLNSVKIYYRGIATQKTATLASASLTQSAGGTTTNSKFTVTAQDSWYDAMGLEFYMEAKDASGRSGRFPAAANEYVYSYITYPAAQRPKVTGLSFGEDATAYRIISVPFKLSDNRIASVFDEFGTANKKSWRMFTYAGNNTWSEFDGGVGLSTLERGKGYWIITKSNVELFIEGAQTPEFNRTKFDEITLNAGWNQIGNPYPVAISWTETIAGKSGIGVLKKYSNGGYTNADVLNPYEGAFVFVTSGGGQKVTVGFQGVTSGGRSGAGVTPDLASQNWELPIKVEQGQTTNEFAGIGMNLKADLNFDQFDDLNMPAPQGLPKAEVSFAKQGGSVNELAKDVVPTQSEFVWHFNFNTNSDELATFKWPNDLFGNNSKELVLMDEGTQRLIDMRSETSYTFDPTVSKNFRIYFGENLMSAIKPSRVLLGQLYPNPATEQVFIPFTLSDVSSAYLVRLEAYNMQGTRVGVLYEGELAPGFYQREWSLHAANLAYGVYLIKMSVSGNGARETQIQKIIINR